MKAVGYALMLAGAALLAADSAVMHVRVRRLERHAVESRDENAQSAIAIRGLYAELPAPGERDQMRADIAKALARTEYLYLVADVLVHDASGWISDRTRMPTAPLGWSSLFVVREPKSWRELTASEAAR